MRNDRFKDWLTERLTGRDELAAVERYVFDEGDGRTDIAVRAHDGTVFYLRVTSTAPEAFTDDPDSEERIMARADDTAIEVTRR